MAFPQDPLDLVTELFVANTWTDISGDVYTRDGVTITRGRPDEASSAVPSGCTLTLNNRAGKYSPRNPLGPFYGSLGRNTPLRLALRRGRDTFARTVSGGWGSADSGHAWTTFGAGGTVAASDWNVAAGVGTMLLPAANVYRLAYLADISLRDVEVDATVTVPPADITGGQLEPLGIILRGASTSDYIVARMVITTAEAITLELRRETAGVTYLAPVTILGITHTAGQTYRMRAQIEGQTLRAKVWIASAAEPLNWSVTAHVNDADLPALAGVVGVRSGTAAGSTNVPITLSWDNVTVRIPRFAGEVPTWPPRWDISGKDASAPIEVAGIRRRLGQGSAPLQSTLYRGITTVAPSLIAYWPCEDGGDADSIASALPDGRPMTLGGVDPQFSTFAGFAASKPLPAVQGSIWTGPIVPYASTGVIQLRFVMRVPLGYAPVGDAVIARIWTTGTARFWDVHYIVGGSLALRAYTANSVKVLDTGNVAFATDDVSLRFSLELTNSGANVNYLWSTLKAGSNQGGFDSGTLAGHNIGRAERIVICPYGNMPGDLIIGHVSVQSVTTSLFDLSAQLKAYVGETADARIQRLCGETGIPYSYVNDGLTTSAAMGAQRPESLLSLLDECAHADLGSIYEPRGAIGLEFRSRASVYNRAPQMSANVLGGDLAPPWEPTDDDQLTRNDVTATRPGGSLARITLESGPLSVLPPGAGGVGRYDTSEEVNVATDGQLPDVAGWLMHQGTVDEHRYPSISIALHNPSVAARTALVTGALGMNIDDRIAVAGTAHLGIYDQVLQLARGYREVFGPFEHSVTWQCAPASPFDVLELDAPYPGTATGQGASTTPDYLVAADADATDIPIGAQVWLYTSAGVLKDAFPHTVTSKPSAFGFTNITFTPNAGAVTVAGDQLRILPTVANRLGSDDSTLAGGVTNSATALSVAIASSTLWTTDPTEMPIPITLGGEQMWVTAISGASSPQTFTVLRSVNGVVKAQTINTQVWLARRSTLAL